MKAEELMVGDWVEFISKNDCGTARIVGIVPREGDINPTTFTVIKNEKDGNHLFVGVRRTNINPIPITPEILEKNGFVETDVVVVGTRKMIWESEDGRTEITIWMDDTMPMHICKNIYYEDEVCYTLPFACTVHELQHALRLCGIDKTIEL